MQELYKVSKRWGIWFAVLAIASIAVLTLTIAVKPAHAATSLSVEAENMQGAGKVFRDGKASKNRAKVLYGNSGISTQVKGSIRFIAVRARGDRCVRAPLMKVLVDGKRVMLRRVKNQRIWRDQKAYIKIPQGRHKVEVRFINDRKTRQCDRNLRVDKLVFRGSLASTSRQITLGAYAPEVPWNPSKIDEFTKKVGTSPKIIGWFESWSDTGFSASRMEAAHSRGAMPMVTWNSWDHRLGKDQPRYALRTIVRGDHDAYIRRWAKDAAAYGKPVYLRFDHEMNTNLLPWGVGANGNTSDQYVAAWRHAHTIFRQERATNVRWVWSPNVAYGNSTPFSKVYPGDAYVDWVALDGYNWGTTQSWSKWTSFANVFGPSYDLLTRMTNKPVMIAEVGSAEAGGNKAAWIRQGFLQQVPSRFPRVRAIVYSSGNWDADWRVDSSSAALAAFREVASSPKYRGRMP